MKFALATASAFALLLAVQAAAAQPAGRVPADTDRDSRITYDEMRTQAHARFARLDLNRDGRLTRSELVEGRAQRQALRGERRFGQDGVLTRDEARARADQRFARLDADQDGRLTPQEVQAGRRAGGRMMRVGSSRMRMGGARLGRMMGLDGEVTLAEFDASLQRRFERRDRNGDGAITPDERRDRRMHRGARQGG